MNMKIKMFFELRIFRHMSPHMVNVHQFYPEIAFSTDKGVVGEVVDVPKSASRGGKKSSLKIDPQVRLSCRYMIVNAQILQANNTLRCIFRLLLWKMQMKTE